MDDIELIHRVLNAEPDAAGLFVDRYSSFIWSVLRAMTLPESAAEEIFQDVFVHLLERGAFRLGQWRGEGRFTSYLAIITRRLAFDYLRRLKAAPASLDCSSLEDEEWEPLSPDPGPDELAILGQQRAVVQDAVTRLPDRDRELIRRRHFDGLSYKEIAGQMGLPVAQVGVYLSRAEARLGKTLRQRYPGWFDEI